MATSGHATVCKYVLKRDHGVCALCGTDTIALREEVDRLSVQDGFDTLANLGYTGKYLKMRMRLWCADHLIPFHKGGADELSNYRTLCYPCHVKVTIPQATEWPNKGDGPWGPIA